MEALDHQIDDLAIARDIVQADQLGSDLENFSAAPGMFMLIAEHGGSIGKTQGQRRTREPHGNRPGNLRRSVRTKQERPPRRTIDELIALLDQFRLKAWRQDVEILERGKNDLVVAPWLMRPSNCSSKRRTCFAA